MEYIVLSTAVTDEIHFADGSCLPHVAGGAGIYALAGMKVWSDAVGIVTGVGDDYLSIYGDWYRTNGISTKGLLVKDRHTPHNVITYYDNGERREVPRYGLRHYEKIEGTPEDLSHHCAGSKGVYVFKNSADKDYWEQILALKRQHGFALMWEIGTDAVQPHLQSTVKAIVQQLDIFSINRTEALTLMDCQELEAAMAGLLQWQVPMIYLRCGSMGAYVLADGKAVLVPSVQDCTVVDVTGGGNSSSGGALVGWCQTQNAVQAARMGNISASFCIAQYGVPPVMDGKLRAEAAARLLQIRE